MFAFESRDDALVPAFNVSTSSAFDTPAERRAHPAGTSRSRRRLPVEALGLIAIDLATTAPQSNHPWIEGTRRRYTRLVDADLYDAWMIDWSASSSLELHDHGGSQGAVIVITGRLVETYTDLHLRHPIRTRIIDQTESFSIPATRVHEVSNPGPGDALSVHVYSPPLKSMTFFDPRPNTFLTPLATTEGDLATLEEKATTC